MLSTEQLATRSLNQYTHIHLINSAKLSFCYGDNTWEKTVKKEREMWECNKKCSSVHTSLTAKCKIVTKNSLFMFLDTNYCLLFRFFFFWVINYMNYVTLLCLQHLWFRQRSNNCILMQTRLPFKIGKWKFFCIYVTGYENNIVKSPVGEHETTVKLVSRNTNQKNLWLFLKIPWGCGAM